MKYNKKIVIIFLIVGRQGQCPNPNIPFTLNDQVKAIKKCITFKRKTKIEKLLIYAGYFRMSRYAKDLYGFLSAGILSNKPDQNDLLDYYNFDIEQIK